ncbi:MAG: TerB family tellurite resistance protein [Nitratireductor sp.]
MAEGFLAKLRVLVEGDPAVRRVADDPVLSAELLLLFRMILADGEVDEKELETFRRICREAFGIGEDGLKNVIRYLHDFGYETTGSQALALFRTLERPRRVQLARHMAEIAKSDSDLSAHEVRLLRRTLDVLDLEPSDVVGSGAHGEGEAGPAPV